jgi:hypothetical protein
MCCKGDDGGGMVFFVCLVIHGRGIGPFRLFLIGSIMTKETVSSK